MLCYVDNSTSPYPNKQDIATHEYQMSAKGDNIQESNLSIHRAHFELCVSRNLCILPELQLTPHSDMSNTVWKVALWEKLPYLLNIISNDIALEMANI